MLSYRLLDLTSTQSSPVIKRVEMDSTFSFLLNEARTNWCWFSWSHCLLSAKTSILCSCVWSNKKSWITLPPAAPLRAINTVAVCSITFWHSVHSGACLWMELGALCMDTTETCHQSCLISELPAISGLNRLWIWLHHNIWTLCPADLQVQLRPHMQEWAYLHWAGVHS